MAKTEKKQAAALKKQKHQRLANLLFCTSIEDLKDLCSVKTGAGTERGKRDGVAAGTAVWEEFTPQLGSSMTREGGAAGGRIVVVRVKKGLKTGNLVRQGTRWRRGRRAETHRGETRTIRTSSRGEQFDSQEKPGCRRSWKVG